MNSLHLPCWEFYLKKDSVQQITVWDLYPVLEEILDPKEFMSSQRVLLCRTIQLWRIDYIMYLE